MIYTNINNILENGIQELSLSDESLSFDELKEREKEQELSDRIDHRRKDCGKPGRVEECTNCKKGFTVSFLCSLFFLCDYCAKHIFTSRWKTIFKSVFKYAFEKDLKVVFFTLTQKPFQTAKEGIKVTQKNLTAFFKKRFSDVKDEDFGKGLKSFEENLVNSGESPEEIKVKLLRQKKAWIKWSLRVDFYNGGEEREILEKFKISSARYFKEMGLKRFDIVLANEMEEGKKIIGKCRKERDTYIEELKKEYKPKNLESKKKKLSKEIERLKKKCESLCEEIECDTQKFEKLWGFFGGVTKKISKVLGRVIKYSTQLEFYLSKSAKLRSKFENFEVNAWQAYIQEKVRDRFLKVSGWIQVGARRLEPKASKTNPDWFYFHLHFLAAVEVPMPKILLSILWESVSGCAVTDIRGMKNSKTPERVAAYASKICSYSSKGQDDAQLTDAQKKELQIAFYRHDLVRAIGWDKDNLSQYREEKKKEKECPCCGYKDTLSFAGVIESPGCFHWLDHPDYKIGESNLRQELDKEDQCKIVSKLMKRECREKGVIRMVDMVIGGVFSTLQRISREEKKEIQWRVVGEYKKELFTRKLKNGKEEKEYKTGFIVQRIEEKIYRKAKDNEGRNESRYIQHMQAVTQGDYLG